MTRSPTPRNLVNTRRWPRFYVHLPVFIAADTLDSQIAIPGMVSAISRAGLEVYGGVPLQPGDLMQVEFRAPSALRIAGVVRNRSGYCFGLEFLKLSLDEDAPVLSAEFLPESSLPDWAGADMAQLGDGLLEPALVETAPADETLAALFIERHQAYLRASRREIERLRRGTQQIRHMREAMRRLLEKRAAGL